MNKFQPVVGGGGVVLGDPYVVGGHGSPRVIKFERGWGGPKVSKFEQVGVGGGGLGAP